MFGKTLFDPDHSESLAAATSVVAGASVFITPLNDALNSIAAGQNKNVAIVTGLYAILRAYSNWRKARKLAKAAATTT